MTDAGGRSRFDPVNTLTWVFAALTCVLAVVRFFDPDEIEHVHATWHVLAGRLPFVDFFEHHHPLLWYMLAPVLSAAGESARAMIVFRLIFLALTFAIARVTYLLALETGAARATARLAVLLLLSTTTFVYTSIEIRPDVPQALAGMLAALFLVRLFRTGRRRHAWLSGLTAAISFLFLQKALFLLAVFPLLFGAAIAGRRLPWRAAAWWIAAFACPVAIFAAWLMASGSWHDYLWSNWRLNVSFVGYHRVSALNPFTIRELARSAAFFAMAAAMVATLVRRGFRVPYALPAVMGLVMVGLVAANNKVSDRYLAAAVPLLAVAVAAWIAPLLERQGSRRLLAWALLGAAVTLGGVAMIRATGRTNQLQLAQIQYVLDRTTAADRVYDRGAAVNLFRPDVHYFWFLVRGSSPVAVRFVAPPRSEYDVCRVVGSATFVYNAREELEDCGLLGRYRQTPFPMLFERGDRR
jgi:hypothetical protein